MSNRRRPRAELDAALRQAVGCVDCRSTLRVRRGDVQVFHQRGCPALGALQTQGRAVQVAIVLPAGADSANTHALVALTADQLAGVWPHGVRVAESAYADLFTTDPNNTHLWRDDEHQQ